MQGGLFVGALSAGAPLHSNDSPYIYDLSDLYAGCVARLGPPGPPFFVFRFPFFFSLSRPPGSDRRAPHFPRDQKRIARASAVLDLLVERQPGVSSIEYVLDRGPVLLRRQSPAAIIPGRSNGLYVVVAIGEEWLPVCLTTKAGSATAGRGGGSDRSPL